METKPQQLAQCPTTNVVLEIGKEPTSRMPCRDSHLLSSGGMCSSLKGADRTWSPHDTPAGSFFSEYLFHAMGPRPEILHF